MQTKDKIQPWVAELIQSYGGIYNSPNQVELIVYPEDETFFLGCRWPAAETPGTPRVRLEITREFEDFFAFTYIFPLQDLHDLDYLTPEGLFKLYGMGEMNVSALAGDQDIQANIIFRIENGIAHIKDDETERPIPYSGGLISTPEQIISFTRKYFNTHLLQSDAKIADKIYSGKHSP